MSPVPDPVERTPAEVIARMTWIYEELRKNGFTYDDELMTDDDIRCQAVKDAARFSLNKQRMESEVREEMRARQAPAEIQTQIITLSYDQKLNEEDAIKAMNKTIQWFYKTRLKSMEQPIMRFEFYGKDESWNPHCHIFTYKNLPDGRLALRLRASLKTKVPEIYRINVKPGNQETQQQYVMGIKKEEKQAAMDMDEVMRTKHSLQEFYTLENNIVL